MAHSELSSSEENLMKRNVDRLRELIKYDEVPRTSKSRKSILCLSLQN